MTDQLAVLKLLTARLDSAGIQYMITGSIAAGQIDFIIRKDSAYREEEFDRRRRVDIDGQAALDWRYIDRWAASLGVAGLLKGLRP